MGGSSIVPCGASLALALTLWLSWGCAPGGSRVPASASGGRAVEVERPGRAARVAPGEDPVVALVGDRPLTLSSIAGALLERSGAEVIDEIALERTLEARCAEAGVEIGEADIAREESLLRGAMLDSGVARDEDEAARMLLSIRRQRRLGEHRYASLLRRNAMLRALVADRVVIAQTSIDQAYQLRFGTRYRARIIACATSADAASARAQVLGGEDFSSVAARWSTDASAARGGVIDPVSAADPSYPAAIRNALASMEEGQVSDPILVDSGFVLLRLDAIVPERAPDMDGASLDALLRRDVRRRQERILMDELARTAAADADVTVVDESVLGLQRLGGG